jgi:peptide deformylase
MAQPFPAQRPVLQQGDPRLRQLARPVTQFDGALQTLIDDLVWTAEQTNGWALPRRKWG